MNSLHKEDIVPSQPKDRERELTDLLLEQENLYERLYATSMALREALIRRQQEEIRTGVREMETLIAGLREHERQAAVRMRDSGFLDENEPFNLKRLSERKDLDAKGDFAEQVRSILRTARKTARAATINRHLIRRMADWNQNEARILLDSPSEPAPYGASGKLRTERTAGQSLVDRRG